MLPTAPARAVVRRRFLLLVLFAAPLLLACAATPSRAPSRAAELRVLVYNVHAGKDAAGQHNLARVAEVIRATRADLVLLQEVDRGTERSGGEDQLAELERMTAMHGAFGNTLDYQGGEYGIAVLSRWPVRGDTLYRLPVSPPQQRAGGSYEPRGALHVEVLGEAGRIHLLNTHLDASGHDRHRVQEVARVSALADSLRQRGGWVLVGGDFNAEPGTRVIEHMTSAGWRDAWAECGEGAGLTYPAVEPVKRIDYLFISAPLACRSARVLESQASDHRALFFVLSPRSEP